MDGAREAAGDMFPVMVYIVFSLRFGHANLNRVVWKIMMYCYIWVARLFVLE